MGNYGEVFYGLNGMDTTGLCCTTQTSPYDNKGTTLSSPISLIHSEIDSNDVQLCIKNYEEAMSAEQVKMDPTHVWHYVELMLEMKNNGELTSTCFSSEQFHELSDILFSIFHVRFSKEYLRRKYNFLRTEWKTYRELKGFIGVSVEPRTGALNADDEQWAAWLMKNPTVKKFRQRGPPFYEELTKLFHSTTATSDISIEQGNAPANSDEERAMENLYHQHASIPMSWQHSDDPVGYGVPPGQASGVNEVGGSSRRSGKRPVSSGMADSGRSSKKSRDESIGYALDCWAKGQLAKQGNMEDTVTVAECMRILNAMEIHDNNIYFKATNYFRDSTNRVIFKMTDPTRRLALLDHAP